MSYAEKLHLRSQILVQSLERRLGHIGLYWLAAAGLACLARVAVSNVLTLPPRAAMFNVAPYLLVICAPVASLLLAIRVFGDGERIAQPAFRIARWGRWTPLAKSELQALPYYGVSGILASLLIGLLLNIPVRVAEFLTALPLLGQAAPGWFAALYRWMLVDTVLLTSLYAIAFAAALRKVPHFPRMLLAIWMIDLSMQLAIAGGVAAAGPLPLDVQASLTGLLSGNIKKVLISVIVWLPYLILSRRVNATYRGRVRS